jgi:hypothetical protein
MIRCSCLSRNTAPLTSTPSFFASTLLLSFLSLSLSLFGFKELTLKLPSAYEKVYRSTCTKNHYWSINSGDLAVAFHTALDSFTFFTNGGFHTTLKQKQPYILQLPYYYVFVKRAIPRASVAEQVTTSCCSYRNPLVRVLHKPRRDFFVSCGWLQIRRLDFFPLILLLLSFTRK